MNQGINFKVMIFLILGAILAGAGLGGLRAGPPAGWFPAKVVNPASSLNERLRFDGMLEPGDLDLSKSEVQALNRVVLKNSSIFPKVDVKLDRKDLGMDKKPVLSRTQLVMAMTMTDDEGRQYVCWNRTMPRHSLVPSLVDLMKKAADTYKRSEGRGNGASPFNRVYL